MIRVTGENPMTIRFPPFRSRFLSAIEFSMMRRRQCKREISSDNESARAYSGRETIRFWAESKVKNTQNKFAVFNKTPAIHLLCPVCPRLNFNED